MGTAGHAARLAGALVFALGLSAPALAIDPPYQPEMERLAHVLGSLYFLQPLCGDSADDWRKQFADLVASDDPTDDRKQRLYGAFNDGYEAYARLYRVCTPSAQEAMTRLLSEGEQAASDIHSRYAE